MANGQKLATPKQLAYIERLAADCETTVDKPLEELTVHDASEIIDDLLGKANGGRSVNQKRDSWSNCARIGLAFKVCYQQWVTPSFEPYFPFSLVGAPSIAASCHNTPIVISFS